VLWGITEANGEVKGHRASRRALARTFPRDIGPRVAGGRRLSYSKVAERLTRVAGPAREDS